MLLDDLTWKLAKLEPHELETFRLETTEDFTDQASLDAIHFYKNEGTFHKNANSRKIGQFGLLNAHNGHRGSLVHGRGEVKESPSHSAKFRLSAPKCRKSPS